MARSAFANIKAEKAVEAPVVDEVPSERRRAGSGSRQANRIGKRTVIYYEYPEVAKAIAYLKTDRDTTIQALMREAVNDLLVKYGKEKPTRPLHD